MEPFPDLGSLSDADLKQLIDQLTKEELEVSYRRRILHGRIDLLRAELQARLQKTGGKSVLEDVDVDKLAAILAGKAAPPDEAEEGGLVSLEDLGAEGPALVVRSGGGRAGEHFVPQGERTTIGRSPDCDVFLDDVTVSRKHAVLVQKDGAFFIEDQGSLNGTFLNRHRIESGRLENGDELQIGKYKLSFLEK